MNRFYKLELTTKLIAFILLIALSNGYSQRPFGSGAPTSNPSSQSPSNTTIATYVPDSTIIEYYNLKDINNVQPFTDTLFEDFEKYSIARTFDKGAYTLGNLGSASQKLFYEPTESIVTNMGFHQYDIYKKSIADFPIYIANRTFNDLEFSPLNSSQNFFARAKFTRTYENNINLSIDYNRTAQEGFYQQQGAKATQLGVAFVKENEKKTHKYIIGFAANNFNDTHNGGVTVDLYSEDYNERETRNERLSIPVSSSSTPGQTRHQNFSYSLDNFFYLDSARYNLHHQLIIEHGYYQFSDQTTNTEADSLVYKDFLSDSRGLRFLNRFNRVSNQFDVGLKVRSFDVNIGIIYNLLSNNNTLETERYNDVNLLGQINFKIKNFTQFSGRAELGVGENVGNIKLIPQLLISPFDGLKVNAYSKILRYDPSILHRKAIVTDQVIYDNDFSKINEFVIGGNIKIDKLNLEADLKSGVISNPISYTLDALPIQKDGSTEYLQIKVKQKAFWRFIGIENSIGYQNFTDNIYALPKVYSIHNLYLQSFLFKKRLLGQLGILLYNYDFDESLEFMPLTGQFFPSENSIRKYYYTELYGNFKVDQFRIFFKMENFTDLLIKEPHFQIVNYPQFDAKFRLGVRWQLYD